MAREEESSRNSRVLYVIVYNTLSICHEDLYVLVAFLFFVVFIYFFLSENSFFPSIYTKCKIAGPCVVLAARVCYFSDNLSFPFHKVHIQFEESLFAVSCALSNFCCAGSIYVGEKKRCVGGWEPNMFLKSARNMRAFLVN